jgi:hypothetical protein
LMICLFIEEFQGCTFPLDGIPRLKMPICILVSFICEQRVKNDIFLALQ